jgi:hypothetical protein
LKDVNLTKKHFEKEILLSCSTWNQIWHIPLLDDPKFTSYITKLQKKKEKKTPGSDKHVT